MSKTLYMVTISSGSLPVDTTVFDNKAQAEAAKANKAVAELDSSVRSFKNTVETTFRDGIISESEAQSSGESISQIGALKEQVTKSIPF